MDAERVFSRELVLLSVFCLLWMPGLALAQLPTGTILGKVVDESSGVVPGATVTATNTGTALARNTVSGSDGGYRIPALPVGSYEVRVELPGFRTEVRSGLTLNVAQ